VDGVDGAEFGEGPAVLAVPVLFAGPDEFVGCFLFLTPGTPLAAAFFTHIPTHILRIRLLNNKWHSNFHFQVHGSKLMQQWQSRV
jgi:hypothetical protein